MVDQNLQAVEPERMRLRTVLPERGVPDTVVDEVADEVASLIRRSELRCAFEVGRLVTERFFGGDLTALHRPGPKAEAVARLAEQLRGRGVGSVAALHVCIGVYETLAPMGDISARKGLTKTHVRAVLPLPLEDRIPLLLEAERNVWSTRELEAAATLAAPRRRHGRPRRPGFTRGIDRLTRLLAPDGLAFRDLDQASGIDPSAREANYARLVEVAERLESLMDQLRPKRLAAGTPARGPGERR